MKLCRKVMSLLPNILSGFGIAFLLRSRNLLVLWLQSPSTMILEPPKSFHFLSIYLLWSDGTRCHDLSFFLMLSFKPAFSLSVYTLMGCEAKEWQCCTGVAAAGRREPWEEIPHIQDQEQPPRGDTPCPMSGVVAEEHFMQRWFH